MEKLVCDFSVTELILIVIVFLVLTACTLSGYYDITVRINDSARVTDTANLGKRIDMYHKNPGAYGYADPRPATCHDFLSLYQIQSLSKNLTI